MAMQLVARFLVSKVGLVSLGSLIIVLSIPHFVHHMTTVHGGYTSWSLWSPCLKTCGKSIQGRVRNCTNPKPSGYGKDCLHLGPYVETRPCESTPCPVNGQYSNWSEWKECDKPCRDGKRKRTRSCNSPAPTNGGKQCEGPAEEEELCSHLVPCSINGVFSNWGEFSACSVTCGPGHKTRTRQCNNPAPQFGGKNCEGPPHEVQSCNDKACDVKKEENKT